MSTCYYLVCDDCKIMADGASRTEGDICPLGSSEKQCPRFIVLHHGHNIKIISEHELEGSRPEFIGPYDKYKDIGPFEWYDGTWHEKEMHEVERD